MLMSFQSGKKLGDEFELCLHKLEDKLKLSLNGGDKKKKKKKLTNMQRDWAGSVIEIRGKMLNK